MKCVEKFTSLAPGGDFVFSCEHPIFTEYSEQDWYYGEHGELLHWSVDEYQSEGIRQTSFLGEDVIKYY